MTASPDAIRASYAACRQAARRSRSSFYSAFLLLPGPKRRAMDALYAFMRRTDDLADSCQPIPARREALADWRTQLAAAFEAPADCPDLPAPKTRHAQTSPDILPAVADAVHRFQIPVEHLVAVLDGVEMDLHPKRYETFDELAEYCHRVASAVGLACIYIWGFRGSEPVDLARQCGLAFQWTNILRDLKEDAEQGRVYLPLEDLRRFDCTPDALGTGVADERFLRLVRFECERAEQFYREGAELIHRIEPDGRRVFGMMTSVYHQLLVKIGHDPAALLARRVRLTRWEKARIAARWTILPPRRSALP